jgi:addiction module HigA family antidote
MAKPQKLPTIHPGTILKTKFMEPLGLSANKLASFMKVPPNRVSAVVKGDRSITGDTALRLSKVFGTTAGYWMNLQSHYDLDVAEDAKGMEISKIAHIAA